VGQRFDDMVTIAANARALTTILRKVCGPVVIAWHQIVTLAVVL